MFTRFGKASFASQMAMVGLAVAACGGSTPTSSSSGPPLGVAIVAEMTGPGASTGQGWNNGVRYAITQINKEGGILGHQLDVTTADTQTVPSVSVAAMRQAIQNNPYVIMGTVYSSSTIVNAPIVSQAGIPQFVGSQSDALLGKSETLFLTEPTNNDELTAFTTYIKDTVKAKKVAIVYAQDAASSGANDSYKKLLAPAGIDIAADIATDVGQVDFSGPIHRIQSASVDTVIIAVHEAETGHLLQQMAAAGMSSQNVHIVGGNIASPIALNLAGKAADGIQSVVTYSPAVPSMRKVVDAFKAANPSQPEPDANFLKGYMGMWAVAYASKAVGKTDKAAIMKWLRGRTLCDSDYPHLLGSTYWKPDGDVVRTIFIVTSKDGTPKLLTTAPAAPELAKCK